jgi:murein DD-endopeptidase MepM/ murein hydrolase activator NlpD
MPELSLNEIVLLFLCGAGGALVKDIITDNSLVMPQLVKGKLVLGFIGSVVVGGFVGYFVDNSPITAFFAGFTGFAALSALMPKGAVASAPFNQSDLPIASQASTSTSLKISKPFFGNYAITQKFGDNPSWYSANGFAGHFGIDFATPYDTPILACDAGEVSRVGFTSGNGFFCELRHSWGSSLYCHFSKVCTLQIGDTVAKRAEIGLAGNTGAVRPAPTPEKPHAGTHCHFSITMSGITNTPYKNYIDPTPFFEK